MTNTGFQVALFSHQRNFFILKPDVAKMKVITDIQATGATNFISFVLLQLTYLYTPYHAALLLDFGWLNDMSWRLFFYQ